MAGFLPKDFGWYVRVTTVGQEQKQRTVDRGRLELGGSVFALFLEIDRGFKIGDRFLELHRDGIDGRHEKLPLELVALPDDVDVFALPHERLFNPLLT